MARFARTWQCPCGKTNGYLATRCAQCRQPRPDLRLGPEAIAERAESFPVPLRPTLSAEVLVPKVQPPFVVNASPIRIEIAPSKRRVWFLLLGFIALFAMMCALFFEKGMFSHTDPLALQIIGALFVLPLVGMLVVGLFSRSRILVDVPSLLLTMEERSLGFPSWSRDFSLEEYMLTIGERIAYKEVEAPDALNRISRMLFGSAGRLISRTRTQTVEVQRWSLAVTQGPVGRTVHLATTADRASVERVLLTVSQVLPDRVLLPDGLRALA